MPIKDRNRQRLPRLGIIRLGYKKKNARGTEYPAQADHFVLRDAPEIAAFYAEQGIEIDGETGSPRVRELDVLFPFPDVDRNFSANYQVWAGGVLVCQGDGERVSYAAPLKTTVDKKDKTHVYNKPGDTLVSDGVACTTFDWNGEHFEPGDIVTCPGGAKGLYPHCALCKLSSVLKVMMADPELFRFGYYQISTGSGRNYDTISGTLSTVPVRYLNEGVPFKLRLVEEQTSYKDDDGKRKKTRKWFLQLEPDPELTRQLYQARARALVEPPQPVAVIPESVGPEWDVYEDGTDEYLEAEPPAPPPIAEAQAEALAQRHQWTREEASALFSWTRNELVITDEQVLEALGVGKISDYLGSPKTARNQIDEWLELPDEITGEEVEF